MISVVNPYLTNNRNITISAVFNGRTTLGADSFISMEINATMGSNYTIGNFTVRELTASFVRSATPSVLVGQTLEPYVSINGSNMKLGTFIIDPEGVEVSRNVVNIKAYDAMSKLGVGAVSLTTDYTDISLLAATNLLCGILDVDLSTHAYNLLTTSGSDFTIDIPKGGNILQRTMRDIASCLGATAVINVDGELDFIQPNPSSNVDINADFYTDFSLISDDICQVKGMVLNVPGETEEQKVSYTYGDTSETFFTIEADDSKAFTTQADLNTIAANVGIPFSYYGYKLATVGMPFIELGDYIHLTDIEGIEYDLPVLTYTLKFDNGITSEFSAEVPETQTINNGGISGGGGVLSNIVSSLNTGLIQTKNLISQTIEADTARFNALETDKADISDLNAATARISNLETNKADITALNATNANVSNLSAGLATANQAIANKADINFANVNTATINQQWVNDLMVQGGLIAADGNFYKLVGARIYGDVIQANTIRADSLLLQGSNGLYYALNVDALGQATASSDPKYQAGIDGSVLVAHSITADEITTNNLQGTGGWINLASGTFAYSNATTGNYITYDGTSLYIQADALHLSSGINVETEIINNQADIDTLSTTIEETQTSIDATNEYIETKATSILNEIEETYATNGDLVDTNSRLSSVESSLRQTADTLAAKITEIDNNGASIEAMSAMLNSSGLHIQGANNTTEAVIDGDSLVFKKTDGTIIAKFSNGDSEALYLAVKQWLSFGAHRAERISMEEYDETINVGTGFFWIG